MNGSQNLQFVPVFYDGT